MNSDSVNFGAMNADPHEAARRMIALSGAGGISPADQLLLAAHLSACPHCFEFAENSRETIRSLRTISNPASGSLIRTTRLRVRQRARELRRQQERLWVVCACCAAVTLCAAVTSAIVWWGFAWLSHQSKVAAPILASGFIVFCLPAILTAIVLLARGTYMEHSPPSFR